jgi:hypothetical protein
VDCLARSSSSATSSTGSLDPASDARLPIAGYDLVGGYRAWRAAGLPITGPAEYIDTQRTRPRSKSRPA